MSQKEEFFLDISLIVDKFHSILESLQSLVQPETLSDQNQ